MGGRVMSSPATAKDREKTKDGASMIHRGQQQAVIQQPFENKQKLKFYVIFGNSSLIWP